MTEINGHADQRAEVLTRITDDLLELVNRLGVSEGIGDLVERCANRVDEILDRRDDIRLLDDLVDSLDGPRERINDDTIDAILVTGSLEDPLVVVIEALEGEVEPPLSR